MIILDSTKINIKDVYKILNDNCYKKTSSKRFRRFEKVINNDLTYGVEVEVWYNKIVLTAYRRFTIGTNCDIDGNFIRKIDDMFLAIFKDYLYIWKN